MRSLLSFAKLPPGPVALALLSLAVCAAGAPGKPAPGKPAPKGASSRKPAAKPKPKPAPTPAAKPAPAPAAAMEPQPVQLDYLRGLLPGEWSAQPASSQFRLLQFALPKAPGDAAAPSLIVFHFGRNGGGGVEDNVRRWMGMMSQPEDGDPAEVAGLKTDTREGLRLTHVDIPGTYKDRPFPASPEFVPRAGYRMLAAVVETTREGGDGPYFVRIVGPAKSVEAARKGWDAFLASLKAE